jgi:hypothetical protein
MAQYFYAIASEHIAVIHGKGFEEFIFFLKKIRFANNSFKLP